MRNTAYKPAFLLVLIALFSAWSSAVRAQDDQLTKEVHVVRPYEPTLSDAFKINELPNVKDTITISPLFNYNLVMRPFMVRQSINPIPPARMVSEPLTTARKGYAKIGFGYQPSPLAELYWSNERSKTYSYGVWLKHRSEFPKVSNNWKVRAPFYQTGISTFGKRTFNSSALAGEMGYNHLGYNFYGQNFLYLIPPPSSISPEKQSLHNFNANLNFHSTHTDSTHYNYKVKTGFNHAADKFEIRQSSILLHADANKFFKAEKVGASFDFTHHINSQTLSLKNSTIVSVAPWIGLFGKQWRVKTGVDVVYNTYEMGQRLYFYPKAELSYNIVNNYIIPYAQIDGFLEDNSYTKILLENPWTKPGTFVANSSHNTIIKGGIKGNMGAKVAYNLAASFSLIDSAYFFVNQIDEANFLTSYFDVVNDNIRKRSIMGEINISPINSIQLSAFAQYSSYSMQALEKPWHTPNFIANASARYSMQDKIILKTTFYYEGKRPVRISDGSADEIKGITNLNLHLEYRYNRRASAFIDINNLLATRYHLWYLYPAQRFHIMFGVSFAL